MVVMKGLAMTAGSKPTRFAAIGSVQPTSFAMSTVTDMVAHTTAAVSVLMSVLPIIMRSTSMIFTKQRVDSATPQSTAVLISFQITFGASENSSSPRLSARMIVTEAWDEVKRIMKKIRELEDDIYATDSEFKEELVPTLPADGMTEEEEAVVEDFDFEELDLGDDDFSLDDDF